VDIVLLGRKGQLIGWSGLLGKSHYTASGICLEDSKLVRINGAEFMQVLEEDKDAGFAVLTEIIKVVSNRLRNLQSVVLKTM
jgi:toluene monooxygenase system ferredoxin subunit